MIDPVFTLSWPEAVVANSIKQLLPKKDGYSVWVPTSRQQEGIDLMVCRVKGQKRRVVTIQVMASRVYVQKPGKEYRFDTWFTNFKIAPEADFVALFWFCPPDDIHLASRLGKITATPFCYR